MVFAIDTSSSLDDDSDVLVRVQEFLRDVAVSLDIYSGHSRMGVVYFADSAEHQIFLDDPKDSLLSSINDLDTSTSGNTNAAEGIQTMADQFCER